METLMKVVSGLSTMGYFVYNLVVTYYVIDKATTGIGVGTYILFFIVLPLLRLSVIMSLLRIFVRILMGYVMVYRP